MQRIDGENSYSTLADVEVTSEILLPGNILVTLHTHAFDARVDDSAQSHVVPGPSTCAAPGLPPRPIA